MERPHESPAARRQLRVSIEKDGRVLDEAVVKEGQKLSLGRSFWCALRSTERGLPSSYLLFDRVKRGFALHVAPGMHGLLRFGRAPLLSLDELNRYRRHRHGHSELDLDGDFAGELDLDGLEIELEPVAMPAQGLPRWRRRQIARWAAAAAIIAFGTAFTTGAILLQRHSHDPAPAPLPQPVATVSLAPSPAAAAPSVFSATERRAPRAVVSEPPDFEVLALPMEIGGSPRVAPAKPSRASGVGAPMAVALRNPGSPREVATSERGAEKRCCVTALPPDNFVDGTLDPGVVREEIARRRQGVVALYERALKSRPTLSGEIEVRFTVGQGGRVEEVVVLRDSVGDAELRGRVTGLLQTWRFPAPAEGDGPTRFAVPFTFRPQAEPMGPTQR